MDRLLSQLSQKNIPRNLQVLPNLNICSNIIFPSVSQVDAIESHANVAGIDNARLEDRNIKLCAPLPLLFSEELGVPVDQVSESAITTPDTSTLSNPFRNPDISITESAQVTPGTQASDQVNSAFLPFQVERTDISLDSDMSTQSNQHIACSSPISCRYKERSYKARIIPFLRNGEELTVAEISDRMKKEDPEITQAKSWIGGVRKALTKRHYSNSTNNDLNIFERVPTFFKEKLQRWRIKESHRKYLASQIKANDRIIKNTRAQRLQYIRPQKASCLPPIARENKPSQTVQSLESASTTFGVSPLSTPFKKHDTSIAEFAQITQNAQASAPRNPAFVFHKVECQGTSSFNSDTSIQSKETIVYSSNISVHSAEYTPTNLIIECLQNGEELSLCDMIRKIKTGHPEIEALGIASSSWIQRIRHALCKAHYFEKVPNPTAIKARWRIEASARENMAYSIVVSGEKIKAAHKNINPLAFILPHSGSEHESIASTMKPQTAQLSELEFDNKPTRKRLRNIEQDGTTLDNEGEQQAQKRRIQEHNVKLTHESSSATVCLDDGEKLTHQEQEYDQNADDSYWTMEREEELQSAWDIIRKMKEEAESL